MSSKEAKLAKLQKDITKAYKNEANLSVTLRLVMLANDSGSAEDLAKIQKASTELDAARSRIEELEAALKQFKGGGTMNPCIEGKRRNPKTKRCRKICTNGQRRNPKTKRCIAKCRTGFSRSRKSNRCVKN